MEQYFPIHTEGTKATVVNVIEKMPLPCEVTIQPYRTKRSNSQNRLYWAWLREISAQMEVDGEKLTSEDWHDLCRMKWLGVRVVKIGDWETARPAKSTKNLKVSEFAEYLTKIEAHFLSKGVALTFTDDYGTALGKS